MNTDDLARRSAAFACAAMGFLLALLPASAQIRRPAAAPAALTSPSAQMARPLPPACEVSPERVRFVQTLTHTARVLAAGRPLKIVALGSSSTQGAGASTPARSYPSRLAEELRGWFPGHDITVLNRGVGGNETADMLARLDTDVIAEKPDLVLWQVGTNSLLHDKALSPHAALIHEGLERLKATGADIVLIDPQYAPKVIAKPNAEGMVSLIATAAKASNVCLFGRFDLMHHWVEADHLPFETILSPDGLHMNDWSYGCLAKWLAAAIAEAATRPTATATGPRAGR